ncbi:MAG TPA: dual specificity protein phosphatase [Phycisphaerae bacterium]|nr:dual specificity protein phosphatase [Phycisphaerae bacterium]
MTARERILTTAFLATLLAALTGTLLITLAQPPAAPLNATLVEPCLYIGGRTPAPPPQTTATLNLCERDDAYRTDIYQWSPIPDAAPAPSLDWLRTQVDFIAAQRAAGRTVFVHCNAGRSRSAMVITAYLMREHHWSADVALQHLQAQRPVIHPIASFVTLLQNWQVSLSAPPTQPPPN